MQIRLRCAVQFVCPFCESTNPQEAAVGLSDNPDGIEGVPDGSVVSYHFAPQCEMFNKLAPDEYIAAVRKAYEMRAKA